ncbi:MAG: lipid A biosynthesis lauroyl acyltransferase [Xanthobacteraceae bacterium]
MIGRRSKILLDATIGSIAVGLMRTVKRVDRKRAANFAGALLRRAGPLLREHRIGREQLRAAFPEKSDTEIEKILAGVWDNLGRVAAEFVHLDEFAITEEGASGANAVTMGPETRERARLILNGSQARLIFACHLANWEIPAVVAKKFGADTAVLFRRPNIPAVGDAVVKMRAGVMGQMIPTNLSAPVRLAHLLQSGVHVGMLVDQHYTKGVDVTFFGRTCKANPLIALLARQIECPIHGMRVVRLPDGNSFRGEITDSLNPPRDAKGRIDIQGTMQAITTVIEGWVREHPEQWLWLHRRWR